MSLRGQVLWYKALSGQDEGVLSVYGLDHSVDV